jgi:hypothetical protein
MRRSAGNPASNHSHTLPARRRRVMSSSGSEQEQTTNTSASRTQRLQLRVETQNGAGYHAGETGDADVVLLESSADEESDRQRPELRPDVGRQSDVYGHTAGRQAQAHCGAGVSRTRMLLTAVNSRHVLPSNRNLHAEASESSLLATTEDDESSQCVGTDTDTRSQYRDAILGVSNARRSRQQMRSGSQVCPTCALFASFMGNFI